MPLINFIAVFAACILFKHTSFPVFVNIFSNLAAQASLVLMSPFSSALILPPSGPFYRPKAPDGRSKPAYVGFFWKEKDLHSRFNEPGGHL